MSVPNPATVDWVPIFAGGNPLAYRADWAAGTTYVDGDIVVKDGVAYLCAGGPTSVAPDIAPWGNAVANRPAGELAYGETAANLSVTATTEGTAQTVVTAPAITCDGITPIIIQFQSSYVQPASVAGAAINVFLFEDGVSLGILGLITTPAGGAEAINFHAHRRRTPSAGTHTYSIRAYQSGGTGTVGGGLGGAGAYLPASIRISQANPVLLAPAGPTVPTYGLSLPASPADGQEHVLVDSLTNPTYQWRFRYNAGSSSAYKWEYIGGAPWSGFGAGNTGLTLATYALLAAGPSFAVPRAGDYDWQLTLQTTQTNLHGLNYARVGAAAGGTDDTSSGAWQSYFGGGAPVGEISPFGRITGLAAATALGVYVRVAGGTAGFSNARMTINPVRVA